MNNPEALATLGTPGQRQKQQNTTEKTKRTRKTDPPINREWTHVLVKVIRHPHVAHIGKTCRTLAYIFCKCSEEKQCNNRTQFYAHGSMRKKLVLSETLHKLKPNYIEWSLVGRRYFLTIYSCVNRNCKMEVNTWLDKQELLNLADHMSSLDLFVGFVLLNL